MLIKFDDLYRIRHVKCGQEKPGCLKCTSTGRTCDGYAALQAAKGEPSASKIESETSSNHSSDGSCSSEGGILMTLPPMPSTNFDNRELRAIDHFRHRSVQGLSCVLDGDFWSTYVLQMSGSFPAVQHAVIAFSGLHETYLVGENKIPSTNVYCRQQYGRAIKSLRDHIDLASTRRDVTEETLLTCLLFICFEVLQGNDFVALAHLEAGLGIFANILQTSRDLTQYSKQEPFLALAKIFIRLDNQATSLIGSRSPTRIDLSEIHSLALPSTTRQSSYISISQARDTLHVCLSCAHDFLRSTAETVVPPEGTIGLALAAHEKDRHLRSLRAWMQNHQDLLQRVSSSSSTNSTKLHSVEEAKECAILWLTYLVTYIKLSTSLDPDEIAYDSYLPMFKSIMEHAEAILGSRTQDRTIPIPHVAAAIPTRKRFTTEMNVIHPLYFTAFKCRHLPIRQRAIALMRVAGKEGAWDGVIFARISEHILALEEGPRDDVSRGEEVPRGVCELKRVHSVGFRIDRDLQNVWVQCRRRRDFSSLSEDGVPDWDKLEAVLSY